MVKVMQSLPLYAKRSRGTTKAAHHLQAHTMLIVLVADYHGTYPVVVLFVRLLNLHVVDVFAQSVRQGSVH